MISDRPWPSLLALAAALLAWSPGRRLTLRRLRNANADAEGSSEPPESVPAAAAPAWRRWLLAAAAGLAVALLLGGVPGAAAGIALAAVGERLLRARPSDDGAAVRAAVLAELPAACDLLGVCLAAGLPVGMALEAVGEALPAPLGPHLRAVAGLYRMGAEPRQAWADRPPELSALGRAMVRAGESGASVVPVVVALASDTRAAAHAQVDADVHRAGVWVLAPLGLCFLPAFVCLGVVPLVLGIAGDVFG